MWLLILILTGPLGTTSTIHSYPLWRDCYEAQVDVEANWRQAYPGFEAYEFRCMRRTR